MYISVQMPQSYKCKWQGRVRIILKTGESAVCGNRPGIFSVDWYDDHEWGQLSLGKKGERHAEVFSSVDGAGYATPFGKEPYGSGSSDVCLPIPDRKYVTKFV